VSAAAAGASAVVVALALRPRMVRGFAAPSAPTVAAPLGRVVRARLGRPSDPGADRRLGASLIWAATGALLLGPPGLALGAGRWIVPVLGVRRDARRQGQQLWAELPEAADLMALSLSAGLAVPACAELVGSVLHGPVAASLRRVHRRHRSGVIYSEAVSRELKVAAADLHPLLTLIGAAHLDGGPAIEPFRQLAADLAQQRRRRAEAVARRVPVTMLFPLVCCILPAFVLLALVPVLAGSLDRLTSP